MYVAGSCAASDKFGKYYVRADFDNPIPRNKYVVRCGYAFEKTLFAWYDEAEYAAAVVKQHIAHMSKFPAVSYVYYCLS